MPVDSRIELEFGILVIEACLWTSTTSRFINKQNKELGQLILRFVNIERLSNNSSQWAKEPIWRTPPLKQF